jgi:hypothetical protein
MYSFYNTLRYIVHTFTLIHLSSLIIHPTWLLVVVSQQIVSRETLWKV